MESSVFSSMKNTNFKIYCGADKKPNGWDSGWKSGNYTVEWNVTRETYDS